MLTLQTSSVVPTTKINKLMWIPSISKLPRTTNNIANNVSKQGNSGRPKNPQKSTRDQQITQNLVQSPKTRIHIKTKK